MFDLITGRSTHLPSHSALPIFLSTSAQASVIALVAVLPMLYVTDHLPQIPTMMAFVAAPPAPPPPPPPPPPVAAKPKPVAETQPKPSDARLLAPVEEPQKIAAVAADEEAFDQGVAGGVEGGIPGGIVGGVVGGLPEAPPPPPPPPPARRGPVRVGGQIKQPTLLTRIEPEYPAVAVNAHIQGVVILEATVDESGLVTDVRLLRSANPLLDHQAEVALKQWRYSPLVLNGIKVPFILTVTLSFFLQATS